MLNWKELKAYFACASQSGSQDVRYKACIISDMLHENITYLYFQFAIRLKELMRHFKLLMLIQKPKNSIAKFCFILGLRK